MGVTAYRKTIASTEAPRQIERRLLSEVTSQMRQHLEYDLLQDPESKLKALANGLRDAIWRNQKIWNALKFDLMEPENQLPEELRASLISLAIWVERHSPGVMEGKQKLKPLIDINLSVIRGLSGDTSSDAE